MSGWSELYYWSTQNGTCSRAVTDLVSRNKCNFLGYVDEATKRHLPSMPYSDQPLPGGRIRHSGACSLFRLLPSPADWLHREIQAMHDAKEHVVLCSTLHTSDWASAMRLVTLQRLQKFQDLSPEGEQLQLNQMRQERIQRYVKLQVLINNAFRTGLCELLIEDI